MSLPVSWALQAGLHGFLASNEDMQSLLGNPPRVYDSVPQDAVFPFMTLGEVRTRPVSGYEAGREHDVRINAHSRWGGRKEVKEIVEKCVSLLHGTPFSLTDYTIVQSRFIFSDIIRRTDPETFHAVMRFRVVTEEISV